MPYFIDSCNCRGGRPSGLVPARLFSRSDLVAHLLRDRGVARFIVAPAGHGKTALAFEYADIVFSFRHVFWVNAQSPCFLRDLDAQTMPAAIRKSDEQARLVVIEDVPFLGDERAVLLSNVIDELLDAGVEVLVTCVPSADVLSLQHRDRILVGGEDLLLTDEEMLLDAAGGPVGAGASRASKLDRVACVRWGGGVDELMRGLMREELPADIKLSLFVMMAIGEGPLDDLGSFLSPDRVEEAVDLLSDGYAFLGIDGRAGTYRVEGVPIETLARIFRPRIKGVASRSIQQDRDALCARVADAILARGNARRAAEVMGSIPSKQAGAAWLARCGWSMMRSGEHLSVCLLHESSKKGARGLRDRLSAMRTWALYALGSDARSVAGRLVRSDAADAAARLQAAVLALVSLGGDAAREAADVVSAALSSPRVSGALAELALHDDVFNWGVLADVALALRKGPAAAADRWLAADNTGACEGGEGARRSSLLLAASWVLDAAAGSIGSTAEAANTVNVADGQDAPASDAPAPDVPPSIVAVARIGAFACRCAEGECARGDLSWPAVCAASAWERLSAAYPDIPGPAPSAALSGTLHRAEAAIFDQRARLKRADDGRSRADRTYREEHPDAFRREAAPGSVAAKERSSAPMLEVKLFGGMRVRIGERAVGQGELSRRKSRTLLALLVLNRGREMSRARLSAALWPDSSERLARKNFYSVWSQLKHALQAAEGETPYLVSGQTGCRLDARLVTSDAYDFEQLCRSLMFGQGVDEAGWERLYEQVCNDFADDLLPSELDNEIICAYRYRYRTQLVDGLVSASGRLDRAGEVRGALWFAREALRRDRSREDVYAVLMEAQIASGQRGAAIDTYFSCRRFLSDELGIDPSVRIVDLYRSIIETEQHLS